MLFSNCGICTPSYDHQGKAFILKLRNLYDILWSLKESNYAQVAEFAYNRMVFKGELY